MDSEKNKKFFSIAAPTMNLRKRGRGTSQNVPHIYSAGKCADFALCVRTQIDFYLKGGITAHSSSKTRLKRFICLHNGHHARKRNMNGTGTQQKRIFMQYSYYKLAYLCVKKC